jgi:hypothetical protein
VNMRPVRVGNAAIDGEVVGDSLPTSVLENSILGLLRSHH